MKRTPNDLRRTPNNLGTPPHQRPLSTADLSKIKLDLNIIINIIKVVFNNT